jgi:hypothetical protein
MGFVPIKSKGSVYQKQHDGSAKGEGKNNATFYKELFSEDIMRLSSSKRGNPARSSQFPYLQ